MAASIHRVNSVLAARNGIRQAETLHRVDAIGTAADRHVQTRWRALLRAVKEHDWRHIASAWHSLGGQLTALLGNHFARLVTWSHNTTVGVLARSVPRAYLRALPLQEDDNPPGWELLDLLFPPPAADTVHQIVYGSNWAQRLSTLSRLAAPDLLAAIVSQGAAAGLSQRELAKQLLPHVQGVQASARRVARTEGLRIAHAVQRRTDDQLGDLLAGYQVHSAGGENARPDHALRSGTIYWRDPQPGQVGMEVMPQPPVDRGGPHEDGVGVKPNCRCFLTPVLRPPEHTSAETRAVFAANAAAVVPDVVTYSDWFAGADRRRRQQAVGVRRYRTLRDKLGAEPDWEQFVDPVTGKLLPVDTLQAETTRERKTRVERVQALLAQRRMDTVEVATHGYLL